MPAPGSSSSAPALPPAARVLRRVIRGELRGSTRLSLWLARVIPSLHRVPVQVATDQVLCLDMREAWCRDILCEPVREGSPHWEPDEQEVMRRVVRRGEVVFDVGANFGEHCPLLAELVGPAGRLFAFEPNPERREPLTCTLARRGNGRLLPYALADAGGRRVLFLPENRSMSSLANWTDGQATTRKVACETAALDVLIDRGEVPRPDFVKCDVEGGEAAVFRGARRTLDREDAAILLYEANGPAAAAFGERLEDGTRLLATLARACYSFFWVRPGGRIEPLDPAAFPSAVSLLNILAVPASKLGRLNGMERAHGAHA